MNLLQGIHFQSVPIRFLWRMVTCLSLKEQLHLHAGDHRTMGHLSGGREGQLVDRQHGRMLNFK